VPLSQYCVTFTVEPPYRQSYLTLQSWAKAPGNDPCWHTTVKVLLFEDRVHIWLSQGNPASRPEVYH